MSAIISSHVDAVIDLPSEYDASQNGRNKTYPSTALPKLPVYPNANVEAYLAVIATKPLPDLVNGLSNREETLATN